MKKFLLILIIFSWVLLKGTVLATGEKLIINEIMYNPPSKNQWIEIYNPTPYEVAIKGGVSSDSWKIIDSEGEHYLAIAPLQGEMKISPYGYAIISSSALGFLKDYPEFKGTVIDINMNLKESNYLTLIYGPNLSTSAFWSSNLGGDGNDKSLEYTNGIYRESLTWGGTPGNINSVEGISLPPAPSIIIPTPLIIPSNLDNSNIVLNTGKITINEIYADNKQNTYWIELKNADNFDINLANWKIEIGSSKNTLDLPDVILKPKEFLTLDSTNYQFSLDNSDSLVLKNGYDKIISKIDYQELSDGLSLAKLVDQNWKITTTPTLNKENIFTEDKNYNELTGSITELNIDNSLLAKTNNPNPVLDLDSQTPQNHKLPIDFFVILMFIISVSLTMVFLIIKNKLIY